MEEKKRIEFIDLTKGVCIILVIVAHIGRGFAFLENGDYFCSFRMPLYFFISGIFFKSYEGFLGFFIRKINKLIIPFLFFYLGSWALQYIISITIPGAFRLPVQFNELLCLFHKHDLIGFNPPIWFLPALFNCNIMFYLVHYLRDRVSLMFIVTLIIGATGFYLGKAHIELPLYIDVAMAALPFYVTGFWIRRYNFFLFPHHKFDKFSPLVVLASMIIIYFTASFVGMRNNCYEGNIFQFYIAGLAGVIGIIIICKHIKKLHFVSYIGHYSLITLGLHGPILYFLNKFLPHYIHNEMLLSWALLFIVLIICYLLTPIFIKLFPEFVAQKNLIKLTWNVEK